MKTIQRRNYKQQRTERYNKDPEFRQQVLQYNKEHPPKKGQIFYTERYNKEHPEKVLKWKEIFKNKNRVSADLAQSSGNHRKQWDRDEEEILLDMFSEQFSYKEISDVLNRSIKSVDNRIQIIKKRGELCK